ncbi:MULTISPECIES: hypothetical protein [unclassified Mesorhizobium]|nr:MULTISPECIES: hypothetical protein [unclassified Mesorhizobium]MBZ9946906.1 hypothetical protein [Mesorhizobium sp. BR1-1-11]
MFGLPKACLYGVAERTDIKLYEGGSLSGSILSPSLRTLELLKDVIDRFRKDGGQITRTTLKRTIGDNEASTDAAIRYGISQNYLNQLTQGYISLTKSVGDKTFIVPEESYYPVVENVLQELWIGSNYDRSEFLLENTARKDSKIIGPWTRPDFTLVSHKKFSYTIGNEFDVVTFEVKRPDSANVLAVFEALSHTSAATKAYVVFPIDAAMWTKTAPDQESRVKDECSKHGVGLILIESASSMPKPLHVIKARRREIDHERSSDFLGAVLSTSGKERIAKWK